MEAAVKVSEVKTLVRLSSFAVLMINISLLCTYTGGEY